MTAADLTRAERDALNAQVRGMLAYLYRLNARMAARGWDRTDPVFTAAAEAYERVHKLSVHVHYAAHAAGAGGA